MQRRPDDYLIEIGEKPVDRRHYKETSDAENWQWQRESSETKTVWREAKRKIQEKEKEEKKNYRLEAEEESMFETKVSLIINILNRLYHIYRRKEISQYSGNHKTSE